MIKRPLQRLLSLLLPGVLILTSCAHAPTESARPASNASDDPCSVGQSALAGALIGALAGALVGGRDGAAKGAAIGLAATAIGCVAINVSSRQTRTSTEADSDYSRQKGSLPQEPTLVYYAPTVLATHVRRGEPARMHSVVELVNGSREPIRDVREEIAVLDPGGARIQSGAKPFTARSGGRFENTFEVALPPRAPQGAYSLATDLYVNGKLVASKSNVIQVVSHGNKPLVAFSSP